MFFIYFVGDLRLAVTFSFCYLQDFPLTTSLLWVFFRFGVYKTKTVFFARKLLKTHKHYIFIFPSVSSPVTSRTVPIASAATDGYGKRRRARESGGRGGGALSRHR